MVYDFTLFDDVLTGSVNPDYLIDVIGELIDVFGTIVTFTLCEDFAFLLKDYLDKHENGPAIFLLHRAKIKEARGAYAISIQNSMYGFRVFINEDLKDIEDYKNGLDPSQLNLVTFSQRMSEISYSSQITSEDRFLYNAQVKPLSEHWELKKEREFDPRDILEAIDKILGKDSF
ncbi:hypothetical protein GmHk_17G049023 [Glycine max]|nr:hypothetical protein GmHk_17G049023 [Glycine max]